MSGINERDPSKYSMSVSMYRGGARGYGRPRIAPPDAFFALRCSDMLSWLASESPYRISPIILFGG